MKNIVTNGDFQGDVASYLIGVTPGGDVVDSLTDAPVVQGWTVSGDLSGGDFAAGDVFAIKTDLVGRADSNLVVPVGSPSRVPGVSAFFIADGLAPDASVAAQGSGCFLRLQQEIVDGPRAASDRICIFSFWHTITDSFSPIKVQLLLVSGATTTTIIDEVIRDSRPSELGWSFFRRDFLCPTVEHIDGNPLFRIVFTFLDDSLTRPAITVPTSLGLTAVCLAVPVNIGIFDAAERIQEPS